MVAERVWSWAADEAEVAERVAHARRLVGQHVGVVRYYHLDYDRSGVAPDARGPRRVADAAEWQRPSWRATGFHWADYGVEFETATGRVFSVRWDSPGFTEGMACGRCP